MRASSTVIDPGVLVGGCPAIGRACHVSDGVPASSGSRASLRAPARPTPQGRQQRHSLLRCQRKRAPPQAFLEYYYGLFGSNRAGLASLYQDQSMFTFEGSKCQGPAAIMAKLTSLPFNQCKITPASMDFQPSISGGIIVFVTGHVQVRCGQGRGRRTVRALHGPEDAMLVAKHRAAAGRPAKAQ